jgi:hypothetical protein
VDDLIDFDLEEAECGRCTMTLVVENVFLRRLESNGE